MAARLPKVGGDDGNWGQILNDFLSQSHNIDGSIKSTAAVTSVVGQTGIITGAQIAEDAALTTTYAPISGSTVYARVYPVADPTGISATDTRVIQAKIDAANASSGGVVYLAPGVYVTSGLVIKSGVTLRGAGRDATKIRLANSANSDLITVPNFSSLTGTDTTLGEHGWAIESLTLDGNASGQSATAWAIRVYAYAYRISNVEILGSYSGGVFSEWGSGGGGSLPMEAHWFDFRISDNRGVGIDWRGPHDSTFSCGEVISGSFPTYGDTGIKTSAHTGGESFSQIHVWGYHRIGWNLEHSCVAVACQAEGARSVNLLLRGLRIQWSGKVFGTDDYHTNEIGVQFGDTDFTGMTGSTIDVELHNFGATSYATKWVSTNGQNSITGRWWKGSSPSLYAGAPNILDDVAVVCADVPSATVHKIGHLVDITGSLLVRNAAGSATFQTAGSGYSLSMLHGASIDGYTALVGGTQSLRVNSTDGSIQPGTASGLGGRIYSGTGAPAIAGTSGHDYFFRTDTPTVSNQRLYVCTTTGVAGAAVWTGIL
jgi:hypothetical protein